MAKPLFFKVTPALFGATIIERTVRSTKLSYFTVLKKGTFIQYTIISF